MRLLLVLLVACGRATSQPAVLDHHAATVSTEDLHARVATPGGSPWMDIHVDGTGAAARAFCERLVEYEVHGPLALDEMTVARACAPEALPAVKATGAYQLVRRDHVSTDDGTISDMRPDELAHATGQIVHGWAEPDRIACEQMKTAFDAMDYQEWWQDQQSEHPGAVPEHPPTSQYTCAAR